MISIAKPETANPKPKPLNPKPLNPKPEATGRPKGRREGASSFMLSGLGVAGFQSFAIRP